MSNISKIDIDYKMQMLGCILSEAIGSKPFIELKTEDEIESALFFITEISETWSLDKVLIAALEDQEITSLTQLFPPEVYLKCAQLGSYEFSMDIPIDFPQGHIAYQLAGDLKAVGRAMLKLRFRVTQKKH